MRVTTAEPRSPVEAMVKLFDGVGGGVGGSGAGSKVAVAVRSPRMLSVQVLVLPEHAPSQPPKAEPLAGVAVRVTREDRLKLAEQELPQLMPAGLEVTVPVPFPASCAVRAYCVAVLVAAWMV